MARILIAEHNKTTADYLAQQLKKSGHQITQVDNCLDTWRFSTRDAFDVMIVDVIMPGVDGFILAQKALQENPALQVIFLTGFSGVAMDPTPCYAPAPFTTRPFHLKDMPKRVRYMLGQGGLPIAATSGNGSTENNVIYTDFTAKKEKTQQAAQ